MVRLGREVPELPAELLFSDTELRVLAAFARSRRRSAAGHLGEATQDVARLGGWTGYVRAPPGSQSDVDGLHPAGRHELGQPTDGRIRTAPVRRRQRAQSILARRPARRARLTLRPDVIRCLVRRALRSRIGNCLPIPGTGWPSGESPPPRRPTHPAHHRHQHDRGPELLPVTRQPRSATANTGRLLPLTRPFHPPQSRQDHADYPTIQGSEHSQGQPLPQPHP